MLPLREYLTGATRLLAEAGVPAAAHDARALAVHALGLPGPSALLLAVPDPGFPPRYAALVERRRRREPLQHIVGETGFRYLTLTVRPGVFVPRPETEVVAQAAIDAAREVVRSGRPAPVVVDLCCGAGPLALSVASEVEGARVTAVDASFDAVDLTRQNAVRTGHRVTVQQGDVRSPALLADLAGAVDVVVSNPPYIPPDAVPTEIEVRDHDPDLALYGGGADGLALPRAVVQAAHRLLRPGGVLVMEHAEVQAEATRDLARAGFTQVRTIDDLTARPRALIARRN
nr:peptide chain release factor N(5)-glutamine methyltransferase [Serinibacter salmoneus]